MWILTSEHNEYDQHGEYFLAAWDSKPTLADLLLVQNLKNNWRPNRDRLTKLLDTGVLSEYEDRKFYMGGEVDFNLFEYTPKVVANGK